MTTTFIGVDLAWKSRNPTGIAIMEGDRSGAELTIVATLEAEASVLDFLRNYSTANTIVAIDAPLIITNELGQRACETEVGRRYGKRDAYCHSSNLTLYSNAASVALTSALLADGYAHVTPTTKDAFPTILTSSPKLTNSRVQLGRAKIAAPEALLLYSSLDQVRLTPAFVSSSPAV